MCAVDGCEKPARVRGWCGMHHQRWLRHGTTDRLTKRGGHPVQSDREMFDARHIQRGPDECWPWIGPMNSWGYGDAHINGGRHMAHRLAYEFHHGEAIPSGLVVRHSCDNPPCVNPRHLVLGTQAENMADKRLRGRAAKRSRNGAAKLTDEQFELVVERADRGERLTDIARDFGVSVQAISQFLKRQRALTTGG